MNIKLIQKIQMRKVILVKATRKEWGNLRLAIFECKWNNIKAHLTVIKQKNPLKCLLREESHLIKIKKAKDKTWSVTYEDKCAMTALE